jgi:hypothetical protein
MCLHSLQRDTFTFTLLIHLHPYTQRDIYALTNINATWKLQTDAFNVVGTQNGGSYHRNVINKEDNVAINLQSLHFISYAVIYCMYSRMFH